MACVSFVGSGTSLLQRQERKPFFHPFKSERRARRMTTADQKNFRAGLASTLNRVRSRPGKPRGHLICFSETEYERASLSTIPQQLEKPFGEARQGTTASDGRVCPAP